MKLLNLLNLAAAKVWTPASPFARLWRKIAIRGSVFVFYAIGTLVCPVQAGTLETRAQAAAVADGASTLGALALGAAEANPLGLGVIVLKAPMLWYIGTLPEAERADAYAMQASIWGAAAANNVCVVAAIISGGAFAPVCLVAGAAWGFREWSQSSEEREFWDICRQWRVTQPEMKCNYTDPANRKQPPPGVRIASIDESS